ncbi:YtxH domain-containing protein [Patescibacteria group bacterium AH-259-L05]|nr:YtxH domain-containing protein [Patescibacteria group bacterium AH-259-L05]
MCGKKLKKICKAGFLGTALGALLGTLYAKKPGGETRKELREKFEKGKDKTLDTAKKVAHEAGEIKSDIEEGIGEIKKAFKEEEKE